MRKVLILASVCVALVGRTAFAEQVVLDLHDYDDDLMKTLDQTIKYFEPDITAGNARGSAEDAEILQEAFKWMENYFTKKGNADDAVKIAQNGQVLIAAAMKSMAEKNLDAAGDSARDLARTCRSCHDIYKPLKK